MAELDDGYDSYYANRLWQLLPGVYRARDSDDPSVTGPLQELVTRIGAQIAVVRRSIDRLWADQSIETSDDWVIPYIGDLVATNLVSGLDPAGRRRDVAKTIHYRRRKGTLAVLEEIARDITDWDAHLVESFRRLSRTRHNLDPPVGPGPFAATLPSPCPTPAVPADAPDPLQLLEHEGLIGTLTGTPAGGYADLRSVHGASLTDTPFDEYFHTADFRLGQGAVGHYGIPKLLVFLWRLQSFAVRDATPVAVSGSPNQYSFDPTGREVPLFLPPAAPESDDFADTWTSATEWQVPGPLTSSLLDAIAGPSLDLPEVAPYPDASEIPPLFGASAGSPLEPLAIKVWPELGRFEVLQSPPAQPTAVSYQYGFAAPIGAGPYDRTLLGDAPATIVPERTITGGLGLDGALDASGGSGTVTIGDSYTYVQVANVGSTASPITSLLVRAGPQLRPVVRPPAASPPDGAWVFTGGDPNGELILDGLLVSGVDIVLRGAFASVRLTACTIDPGTLDDDGAGLAASVDRRLLAPARIWIEADPDAPPDAPGAISQLLIDNCILGPVRTRNGGAVETTTISDTIIQGIAPASGDSDLQLEDVYDPALLAQALDSADPVSELLSSPPGGSFAGASTAEILALLNQVIQSGASIYSPSAFAGVPLPAEVSELLEEWWVPEVAALNRALLEAVYPVALSPAALALAQGTVALTGVTVMGRAFVHRLQASDSLLGDFTVADDTQDGCVRFSAVCTASSVPRQYRSVTTAADAALFTSDRFGAPGYGQLLETVDGAIVGGAAGATISAGSDQGAEMGAFAGQLGAVKENGLLLKYAEYMPLGLTPVVVHVA
jgi:hypothetical protein